MNNTHKNKSSLMRHINSVHLNQRYICSQCQNAYVRNIDFLKHRINQPVILKQCPENIQTNKPMHSQPKKSMSNADTESKPVKFDINTTPSILEGTMDWKQILRKDLKLSDDQGPKLVSRSFITDRKCNPDVTKSCNTSPGHTRCWRYKSDLHDNRWNTKWG